MLRVALGRARPESKWSEKISTLEFGSNPNGGAGAQASADRSRPHSRAGGFGTNTILTLTRSHPEHNVDIEAGDGSSDENSVREKEN